MTIAYYLQGQDNDSFLNVDLYEKNISECLDYIKNREKFITNDFKIKRTKYEFSYTYDGANIVSKRFKNFCENLELKDIEFFQLKKQKDFYLFKVYKTVIFDSKRRNTQFLEFNKSYSEYNEVVGASPVCLKENKQLDTGFYRTDVEFGRGYSKTPLILVDPKTFELIKKEEFTGLYGEKVLNKYRWEK